MSFNVFLTPLSTYLCTKLQVPSTGSIIQVGLSVRTHFEPAAVDSSAMNLHLMGNKSLRKLAEICDSVILTPSSCLLKKYLVYEYIQMLYTCAHIYIYKIDVYTYIDISFFRWRMENFHLNFKQEFLTS